MTTVTEYERPYKQRRTYCKSSDVMLSVIFLLIRCGSQLITHLARLGTLNFDLLVICETEHKQRTNANIQVK